MSKGQKIANILIVTLFFLSAGVYLSEGKILERRGPIPTKATGVSDEIRAVLCEHCCSGMTEEYAEILEERVLYHRTESGGAAEGKIPSCSVEISSTGHEFSCHCAM